MLTLLLSVQGLVTLFNQKFEQSVENTLAHGTYGIVNLREENGTDELFFKEPSFEGQGVSACQESNLLHML